MSYYYYSNEVVFRGHPDKVCDQISGAILDECLKQDKKTRAGIEVAGGKGKIFITGEVTTNAKFNVKKIARRVLLDIGYPLSKVRKYRIINNLGKQSRDIALGVDVGGAGDQGMMFGFACNDTPRLLPTAMVILQDLAVYYDMLVHKYSSMFYPDGKAQITGRYDENGKLLSIKNFVISYNNPEDKRKISDAILTKKVHDLCAKYKVAVDEILINPTGKFEIGGFEGDAGLTGRKIVVDAYQSFANVGGGCWNGKDPTKVDFSAAHKARRLAIRYLKEKNANRCEVQLSYAIGKDEPLAIYINVDGKPLEATEVKKLYAECTPARIIDDLHLLNFKYEKAAAFGHIW